MDRSYAKDHIQAFTAPVNTEVIGWSATFLTSGTFSSHGHLHFIPLWGFHTGLPMAYMYGRVSCYIGPYTLVESGQSMLL